KIYGPEVLSMPNISFNPFEVKVYPNPNSGVFTVLTNKSSNFHLIDLQGRIISTGNIVSKSSEHGVNSYSLNYSNLSQENCLLNIVSDQQRKVVKVIIE